MKKINLTGNSALLELTDNEVISRILEGEKDLYAVLVRRYNKRLYRVGVSIIHDPAEIEDVMQTAYVHAYLNLSKFEYKSSFSTWLTRILINDSILTNKKRKSVAQLDHDLKSNNIHPQPTIDVQTPFAKMLNSELKTILEEAIRELPEKYKVVFVMREIENMSISDTMNCLNISEANVKVRLNRAKTLLKHTLNAIYNKEELFGFHLSRCGRVVENVVQQIEDLHKTGVLHFSPGMPQY